MGDPSDRCVALLAHCRALQEALAPFAIAGEKWGKPGSWAIEHPMPLVPFSIEQFRRAAAVFAQAIDHERAVPDE